MAFETTVGSGKVNIQTLPNGEIEVYGATSRYRALYKKSGALFWLVIIGQFVIFLTSLGAGSPAIFFAILAGLVISFIFLKMKTNTKWFSIVPHQGVKLYDGRQVAFSDIGSIRIGQAGAISSLVINVRGQEFPLAIAYPAEINYIQQVFENNSSVRFV